MAGYIDKDKALNAIKYAELGQEYEAVAAIPTADVVERKWIPCSERLPITTNTYSDEKAKFRHYFSDDVLITEQDGFVAIGLYAKYWNGNGVCKESWEWRDDMSTALKPDVVAWMLLPEPYKEGANNGEIH